LYATPAAREAYYINAYNVLVWKSVLMRLPQLTNIDAAKVSFFYATAFLVGGDETNLYDLENKIIRPSFHDPRLHMALNCASAGCPTLPREAFTPERLEAQLDREARRFCNDRRNVDYDASGRRLTLSRLFDWYRDDFGGPPMRVVAWINQWRPANAQLPLDAKIDYSNYDWSLNGR
jgi:hypothetical protein